LEVKGLTDFTCDLGLGGNDEVVGDLVWGTDLTKKRCWWKGVYLLFESLGLVSGKHLVADLLSYVPKVEIVEDRDRVNLSTEM
jgi:hypothetical protein